MSERAAKLVFWVGTLTSLAARLGVARLLFGLSGLLEPFTIPWPIGGRRQGGVRGVHLSLDPQRVHQRFEFGQATAQLGVLGPQGSVLGRELATALLDSGFVGYSEVTRKAGGFAVHQLLC